jgi:phenylacetate-CoA ligase
MKNEKPSASAQELEHMALEERQKYLEEKLREVIPYAYKNAPAVKERFDKAGVRPEDVRTINDLEKVPVLRKDDVIELQKKNPPFGGLLAVPIDRLERIYQSPGPIY